MIRRLQRLWAVLKQTANVSIPFYVTRKNADGLTGTWSVSGLVGVAILMLLLVNALLWLIVGLVVAVGILL